MAGICLWYIQMLCHIWNSGLVNRKTCVCYWPTKLLIKKSLEKKNNLHKFTRSVVVVVERCVKCAGQWWLIYDAVGITRGITARLLLLFKLQFTKTRWYLTEYNLQFRPLDSVSVFGFRVSNHRLISDSFSGSRSLVRRTKWRTLYYCGEPIRNVSCGFNHSNTNLFQTPAVHKRIQRWIDAHNLHSKFIQRGFCHCDTRSVYD